MPRVRKWSKPNQGLLFAGEWGICNDNFDCHSEVRHIQTVEEWKDDGKVNSVLIPLHEDTLI